MKTTTALWIVGGAAVLLAVYWAFARNSTTGANTSGLTSASPPPQPVGRTLITSAAESRLGAFAGPGGRQFLR